MPMTETAPRVDWRFATICAALLGLLFGTQVWLNNQSPNHPVSWGFAVTRSLIAWTGWLILAPLIFRAGQSNPLGTDARFRWIRKHLVLAIGFAAAHSVLQTLIREILGIPAAEDVLDAFLSILFSNLAGDILRYSLISLSYQAFAYHWQVRQRDREAARLQLDLSEARLATLEGRLRPHFLFNTLNAIAALIREDPSAAERMLGQLSDLLRASLKADPLKEVTLEDELRLVEQYLAIEQARFQDRLSSSLEASEGARVASVPHLILQPLVENAVRHGIAPRESGGSVRVTASHEGDRLIIIVEDDGVGMGNSPPSLAGSGLGLGGVRSRLTHLYGANQRVDVTARSPSGTRVRLEIPYRPSWQPALELR
jgi:two-component system, LytTR family, sensor kinase